MGGRGTEGSFISGIFTIDGFAGRVVGLMPPFARGISIPMFASLKFFSAISGALICSGGFTSVAATVGLFSANSLYANVPCLSLPFVSALMAYSTFICLPEKNCPFICAMAVSELLKLS